jgi:hypothetical protein
MMAVNSKCPGSILAAALLLASCGPGAVALPEQPVDRAATCGVAAASEARLATADVKAQLPLAAHGRIVHYALLAASEGGEFSAETANTISRRMSELFEPVTGGNWKALPDACRAAYPLAEKKDVTLPEDRFAAQLQCSELAEFLLTALKSQGGTYGNEIAGWRGMRTRLNDAVAPALNASAGREWADQQRARRRALAEAALLGTPTAVMTACSARFPAPV